MSPMNRLYAKRICYERGYDLNFSFLFKSAMNKQPGWTFFLLFVTSSFGLAELCRILERPYFSYCFDPPMEDFRSLNSAIFFVIMTMASAGFGDITTSTDMGRWLTLFIACWGAIMLSLLFNVLGDIFYLEENRLLALFIAGEQKFAGKIVCSALKYNVLKKKRYRMLENGDEFEHRPTICEVRSAKKNMIESLKAYKNES